MTLAPPQASFAAKFVIAIDFGTAFSGFAWALTADPQNVHKFYEWPDLRAAGGLNYCKTRTSLWYKVNSSSPKAFKLQQWGYSAHLKYYERLQQYQTISRGWNKEKRDEGFPRQVGYLVSNFKVFLAPGTNDPSLTPSELPAGLTLQRTISDYLQKIGGLAIQTVRKSVQQPVSRKDVQWCITLPGIWNESSKQQMKTCAQVAGLVNGPFCNEKSCSPHELIVVLEPEAASVYCQQTPGGVLLKPEDIFLTVDVGGCTVDLILQQKSGDHVSSPSVILHEVSPGTGGLCGGYYVDRAFDNFLEKKITGYKNVAEECAGSLCLIRSRWESIKYTFDGTERLPYVIDIPAKLSRAWESQAKKRKREKAEEASYDDLELSREDLQKLFDPSVNEILKLIEQQLLPGVDTIMVVGGFSSSPYLKRRIEEKFSSRVRAIVSPDEPGCAVCCGAVAWGTRTEEFVRTRYSRKTYGISINRTLRRSFGLASRGQDKKKHTSSKKSFDIFTRKGDKVPTGHRITRKYIASKEDNTTIQLFSTSALNPQFVSDEGVEKEGTFIIHHPPSSSVSRPSFTVTTYFGLTSIQVSAEGVNFKIGENIGQLNVTFENSRR